MSVPPRNLNNPMLDGALLEAANPIWLKCWRSRLRWKHILSWGLVVLSITTFFCILFYRLGPGRGFASPEESAKATLLPLIVIQSVILMLLGTGSVAVTISRERENLLLDYQRMTPMSPTSKILGYLFGLPIREYVLFLLTVPFLIWIMIAGNLKVVTILHLYMVFFSSVWVYHMTGLVAGMVSKKPRRAALMSQGLVVLLYLVLPQFTHLGLTFFEYLTFRPTFYGMVAHELETMRPVVEQAASQQFDQLNQPTSVPFFETSLHPTTYSLIVQAFLLVGMYVIVHRRWRDQESHCFSKPQGMVFFGGLLFFLMGGLWPILTDSSLHDSLAQTFGDPPRAFGAPPVSDPRTPAYAVILLVFQYIVGAGALVIVHTTTATREVAVKALRRARKLGQKRVHFTQDGHSSNLLAWFASLGTVVCCVGLMEHVLSATDYFAAFPAIRHWMCPLILIVALVLFFQGVCERFGTRPTYMILFAFWMLPFFAGLILWAADDRVLLASYVAMPCPPVAQAFATLSFFEQAAILKDEAFAMTPQELEGRFEQITLAATIMYIVLTVLVHLELRRWHRKLERQTQLDPGDEADFDTAIPDVLPEEILNEITGQPELPPTGEATASLPSQ